ncbi:AMP-binding protein [Patulibacter brassicae]|uniref:AMP-binding protein n=1 Tax=Patulibacter brassicae TaxID=1705717 RepID=A0ABU4VHV9_9ACTN|nr:AMP-binding protein [Patulibacter brassicae]MDX8151289.1 AMP-binding protein [Patulibacter brassicae]
MKLVPDAITRPGVRLGAAAQNALEVVRFGGLDAGEDEHAPYEVVASTRLFRLRRYFPDAQAAEDGTSRPAIVLVPPMMLSAEIWDVAPTSSAVTSLHEHGMDPWVVDFGAPDQEEGGLERTLTDHVVGVSDAIDRVLEIVDGDVHLGGYSQGGMFCYQAAAYRRAKGLASLITFGSPVDIGRNLPLGIPERVASGAAGVLADVFDSRPLPAWASSTGFKLLDPVKDVRSRIDFLLQLHDREALLPRERQRRFLGGEGFVAWSGPAIAELLRQFVAHNRMVSGGFVIEDRLVTLADITCPVLAFVGEVDQIAQPPAVRAIAFAAPRAEVYEQPLTAGHFGLVVGGQASTVTWPTVAAWMSWRAGRGERPDVTPLTADGPPPSTEPAGPGIGTSIELAGSVGLGLARTVRHRLRRAARGVRELATEAASQVPRLFRLEQIQPKTRISLGLLLEEQAARQPDGVLFLFEDRAHTHAAVGTRIDNIVRGLISVGVRQGQHIGVLMEPRPSALATVAALSRLGAVVVLMRPDGALAREAQLGQIERIVCDPELAEAASQELDVEVLVLGGGGEDRDLGPHVVDMERIDPDRVDVPGWYAPNPGRAVDLAFITFTGEGDRTRAKRITNHRWALSAFGTATAAALTPSDTVYAVTPLHHPSGLMMSVGGAVASGARIALARRFEPEIFWDEVRRYGVTVVSYTWALLDPLTCAPRNPAERHHPVRLFIGSGMPRGVWRRVVERFGTGTGGRARVLEFYASTEGDAVLVNVSGAKPGSKGRPLPGSAEVRLAAWDPDAQGLIEGPDGFVLPAKPGDVGMLLTRVRTGVEVAPGHPVRGVFERGDAWHVTGDLFRVDLDGEFWLVDHGKAAIRTDHGPVYAFPIQDALGDVPAIGLAVTYPLADPDGQPVAVTAVTVRAGEELTADDLNAALSGVAADLRPDIIHVIDEVPLSTWSRPLTEPLRAQGLPPADRSWRLTEDGSYRAATEVPADAAPVSAD